VNLRSWYNEESTCWLLNDLADQSRDVVHLPFLVDAITVLTLIEMGKQMQIRQSQQDVTSDDHQAMLDEVHYPITPHSL
jgi:hypothetical protein